MRLPLLIALLASMASVSRAAEPDANGDALLRKAEACIRAQAPAAASVAQNPNEAVTFVIDGLCAVEVQHFETYQRNVLMLAGWRATPAKPAIEVDSAHPSKFEQTLLDQAAETNAGLAKVTIDPVTGEMTTPPGFRPPLDTSSWMAVLGIGLMHQAHLKAVAAAAVLAADQAARH